MEMIAVAQDRPDVSEQLVKALARFRTFLIADDELRAEELERSDVETLTALADDVQPLFDEINSVLDQLMAMAHPLPDAQSDLEDDLNSLAQAGMEARMELDSRA